MQSSLLLFSLLCLESKQEAEPVVRGTKTSNYHLALFILLFFVYNKQKTTQFQAIRRPLFYNENQDTELAVKSQLPSLSPSNIIRNALNVSK